MKMKTKNLLKGKNKIFAVILAAFLIFGMTANAAPILSFEPPTPPNATCTANNYANINASIAEDDLDTFIFNWNGANYTYRPDSTTNGGYCWGDTTGWTGLCNFNSEFADEIIDPSLVLYMTFNNMSAVSESYSSPSTGDTVYDYSGQGNNGTTQGGITYNPTGGKYGGAFEFDGSGNYISAGNKPALESSSNFTAEAWFKASAYDSRTIFSKRQSSGGYIGWQIRLLSSTSILYYTTYSTTSISKTVTVPDLGTSWHHIVYTITDNVGQLYLDGVPVGTASTGVGSVTTTSAVFSVGSANGGIQFFDGMIDGVRIYNISLSANEVKKRYYDSKLERWKALQNLFRM